jgi:hypothetical protein
VVNLAIGRELARASRLFEVRPITVSGMHGREELVRRRRMPYGRWA